MIKKILQPETENKFHKIYDFICTEILPKYDNLTECYYEKEDDGEINHYYWVRYKNYMEFTEREKLHKKLLESIYNYCIKYNYEKEFNMIILLLVRKNE
ncbi:MAG: hypothetical protein BZ138_07310 [Methanosphaera sp. rholeuAM270]|nr:MAG: hypothetical protein BZ138_07310 [Methanosphaera sp. rholeuAM270]